MRGSAGVDEEDVLVLDVVRAQVFFHAPEGFACVGGVEGDAVGFEERFDGLGDLGVVFAVPAGDIVVAENDVFQEQFGVVVAVNESQVVEDFGGHVMAVAGDGDADDAREVHAFDLTADQAGLGDAGAGCEKDQVKEGAVFFFVGGDFLEGFVVGLHGDGFVSEAVFVSVYVVRLVAFRPCLADGLFDDGGVVFVDSFDDFHVE